MLGTASTAVTAWIICGPLGTRVPSNAAERGPTGAEVTRGRAGADVQALAASYVSVLLVISMRFTSLTSRVATERDDSSSGRLPNLRNGGKHFYAIASGSSPASTARTDSA
jgi:hypothetical protein